MRVGDHGLVRPGGKHPSRLSRQRRPSGGPPGPEGPGGPTSTQWRRTPPTRSLLTGIEPWSTSPARRSRDGSPDSHRDAIRDGRFGRPRRWPPRSPPRWPRRRAPGPHLWSTASAVRIYGADRGDEVLSEAGNDGDGFLADVGSQIGRAATGPAVDEGCGCCTCAPGSCSRPRWTLRLLRPFSPPGWPPFSPRRAMDGVDRDRSPGRRLYRALLEVPKLSGPVQRGAARTRSATAGTRPPWPGCCTVRRGSCPFPGLGRGCLLGASGAEELTEAGPAGRARAPGSRPAIRSATCRA